MFDDIGLKGVSSISLNTLIFERKKVAVAKTFYWASRQINTTAKFIENISANRKAFHTRT